MKGLKTVFICSECEYKTAKWLGKCPNCGAWECVMVTGQEFNIKEIAVFEEEEPEDDSEEE